MDLSLVIPLLNEAESLPELTSWILRVAGEEKLECEIILVDDGSTDASWKVIEELSAADARIRGIRFRRNYGKSAALNVGFEAASGDVVITMDADLQDSPDEIPELVRMIRDQGYDLVSGWKRKRYDNAVTKNIPSKLYNWAARKMSGIRLHDFNCGLKAYRLEVVKAIEVYGEMHRYIPVIAKWNGFANIGEKVVQHRARKYGRSKFGIERFINGFLDLMSISFVGKFGKKPMHFFGTIGTLMFILGFGAALGLGIQKLYYLNAGIKAPLVTSSPYFYIGLVAMILGTQLFLTGFLAEMIARVSHDRNKYHIARRINL